MKPSRVRIQGQCLLIESGTISAINYCGGNVNMKQEQNDTDLIVLEKEAEELRQNLWVWKGISLVLLVLYLGELGDWFGL